MRGDCGAEGREDLSGMQKEAVFRVRSLVFKMREGVGDAGYGVLSGMPERGREASNSAAALLNYNEISARSMAQIKYQNRREYLDYYSEEMVRRLGHRISRMKAQFLVPVPVHPARKRQRGYNQAEELAVRLGKLTGIPVCTQALVRIKKTAPQKELTAGERLKNLEKAFAVRKEFLPPGTDGVILVDDIYTTGSTAEACSRVLKSAGAGRVYILSVCIGGDR